MFGVYAVRLSGLLSGCGLLTTPECLGSRSHNDMLLFIDLYFLSSLVPKKALTPPNINKINPGALKGATEPAS